MINQKVKITQSELNELKNIPAVTFTLPFNNETRSSFDKLVGKPKTRLRKAGVYIFTHKETGKKYVGSSNSLSRRLSQYFNELYFNQNYTGLLMPLMKKDGVSSFDLEIIVMPEKFSKGYYFLFLEQYFLLHSSFSLNSQRIVNFRVNQGNNIYLYNLECNVLYYSGKSLNEIKDNLGIHPVTCVNAIKKGKNYLNFFRITDSPIENASISNLSILDLTKLISQKKTEHLKSSFSTKLSIPISIKNLHTKETTKFTSIKEAVLFLKDNNVIADRNKISKILNTGEEYKGYLFFKE